MKLKTLLLTILFLAWCAIGHTQSAPTSVTATLITTNSFQHAKIKEYHYPASDIVTILSSFTILSIDIFTLNGQSVAHQGKVNAITTAFPLDNLPKGTYIVRIVTPHGTSHKKLVIN